MITRMWILTALLFVASVAAFAQPAASPAVPAPPAAPIAPAAAAAPAETGYVGTITGTDVNVRSGPDRSAYECTRLSHPDRVTVVGQVEEWCRILPPPSCFSVIQKRLVDADADGKTGRVNTENNYTRAGGDLRMTDFWNVQCPLAKGQQVQIIGTINDYYKVVPPPGTYLYVHSQFVQKAPATAAAAAAEPAGLVEAPATNEPATSANQKDLEFVRVANVPMAATQPATSARDSFLQAEKDLQAEFAKPEAQRNFKALLERYQRINTANDKLLATFVKSRVEYLQAAAAAKRSNEAGDKLLAEVRRTQQEYQRQIGLAKVPQALDPLVPRPAVEGLLQPSVVYSGSAAVQRRYFVCDPATSRVKAFAQSTAVDLEPYAGQVVSLYGAKWFDRQTLVDVVDVQQVEVISSSLMHLPPPPRPTIKPREWKPVEVVPVPGKLEPAATQEHTPSQTQPQS